MLLAVDIGNTNVVFGIYHSERWIKNWRLQTNALKTADEYAVIFNALLEAGKVNRKEITKIVLCSVVPTLVAPFSEMVSELLTGKILWVDREIYSRLPVRITNPNEIGADLVANSVAAYTQYGRYTMVIDFGTALTFTTIGGDAEIAGVVIAPGLFTAVNSLAGKTAQLPSVHLEPPPSVLGDTTIHAIQSGILYGYSGLVDCIIEKTEQELDHKLHIVATGGLSQKVAPLTKRIKKVDPMLTLEGLRIIVTLPVIH